MHSLLFFNKDAVKLTEVIHVMLASRRICRKGENTKQTNKNNLNTCKRRWGWPFSSSATKIKLCSGMHLTELLFSLDLGPDIKPWAVPSWNSGDSPSVVFLILYVLTNCSHSEYNFLIKCKYKIRRNIYKYAYICVIEIDGWTLLWPLCLRKWESVSCIYPFK